MSNVGPGVAWGKVIAKQMDKYCGQQRVGERFGNEEQHDLLCILGQSF